MQDKPLISKKHGRTVNDESLVYSNKLAKSNNFQSFINMIKLYIGNAYMSIPNTFSYTGFIGGIVLFSVVGAINCYTMLQILYISDRHHGVPSYSELGNRIYGQKGKLLIAVSIWIMQLSCCISYLYFIGAQVQQIVSHYTEFDVGRNFYILLLTLPALPICWIETYTSLSYLSVSAIAAAIAAMICIFYYCMDMLIEGTSVQGDINYFNLGGIFGHIGVAMFVFEGNACVVNIRDESIDKQSFPRVLTAGVFSTLALFVVFGTVAYLAFLDQSNPIISTNL